MVKDPIDFVRQGAFISLSMILVRQSDAALSLASTRQLFRRKTRRPCVVPLSYAADYMFWYASSFAAAWRAFHTFNTLLYFCLVFLVSVCLAQGCLRLFDARLGISCWIACYSRLPCYFYVRYSAVMHKYP